MPSVSARPPPTAQSAVKYVKDFMKEWVKGIEDGTSPDDGAFSIVYPHSSTFTSVSEATKASKAVKALGRYDSLHAGGFQSLQSRVGLQGATTE